MSTQTITAADVTPQHTPEPWTFDDDEDELGSMAIEIFHEGTPIASVYGSDDFPCVDEDAEDEVAARAVADARLISAAPDLLRAAQIALEQIRCVFQRVQLTPSLDDGLCTAKDDLRDAINKALGKQ